METFYSVLYELIQSHRVDPGSRLLVTSVFACFPFTPENLMLNIIVGYLIQDDVLYWWNITNHHDGSFLTQDIVIQGTKSINTFYLFFSVYMFSGLASRRFVSPGPNKLVSAAPLTEKNTVTFQSGLKALCSHWKNILVFHIHVSFCIVRQNSLPRRFC